MHIRVLDRVDDATLLNEMKEIGVSPRGIEIMRPKGRHYAVRVYGLRYAAANILKQTMLSNGGEAAVSYHCCVGGRDESDALVFGTRRQLLGACERLEEQQFGLPAVAAELRRAISAGDTFPPSLRSNGQDFLWGTRTYIMGIVNVTPDSFSGDGLAKAGDPAAAAALQARRFVDEGADIIDIGGESTRPGHDPVDAEEETRRVIPVVEAVRAAVNVPISVDTYKAIVARNSLLAGADWINDIWGMQADLGMAAVAAEFAAPVVVMHNQNGTGYCSLMGDMIAFFEKSIALAHQAGLPDDRIIIDPGIGFGKTLAQNLEVMARLGDLKSLGRPILVGTSRKSMIGHTLNLPENQRVEGTAATVALAISGGADIVRVHDVKAMTLVSRMADATVRIKPE